MAHAATLRATSFAASAGLLALAAIAALTMSFTIDREPALPDPTPVIDILTEPPLPPPVAAPRTTPPPQPAEDDAITTFDPPPVFDDVSSDPPDVGPTQPVGPAMISDPRWLRVPRDLERYYPRRALQAGVTGNVQLDCLVSTTGALHCTVISETPENWGFGAAAIRISQQHQMVPARRDGVAVEGRYRMRVPFQLR